MTESTDNELIDSNVKKIISEKKGGLHHWLKSLVLSYKKEPVSYSFSMFYDPSLGRIAGFFSSGEKETRWYKMEGFAEGKLVVKIDFGEYNFENGKQVLIRKGNYQITSVIAKTNNEQAKGILEKTVEAYNSGAFGAWP